MVVFRIKLQTRNSMNECVFWTFIRSGFFCNFDFCFNFLIWSPKIAEILVPGLQFFSKFSKMIVSQICPVMWLQRLLSHYHSIIIRSILFSSPINLGGGGLIQGNLLTISRYCSVCWNTALLADKGMGRNEKQVIFELHCVSEKCNPVVIFLEKIVCN